MVACETHAPVDFVQMTHDVPLMAMAMPIMPPTAVCVVETGISHTVAAKSQNPTVMMTIMLPYISSAASLRLLSKHLGSAMPDVNVAATELPAKIAPADSAKHA